MSRNPVRFPAAFRRLAMAAVSCVPLCLLGGPTAADDAASLSATPGPLELRALDYIRYRTDVAHLETQVFDNAGITREAHKRLAAHDSTALVTGWMAYAALIAADTPAFADAIMAEVHGKKPKKKKRRRRNKDAPLEGKHAFIAKLSEDPYFPTTLEGADEAIAEVMRMVARDYARVTSVGENFKEQAYSMQKTRWGKRKIGSGSDRIAEAEYYAESRPGMAMPIFEKIENHGVMMPGITTASDAVWVPDWGFETASRTTPVSGTDPVIARILNLAARYTVDNLNDQVIISYAKNPKAEQCLSLSKLTLKQCIAATRTPYEEAFCLGEHGLKDVAGCVGWVAGYSN